jgi:XTP/dITP diphosphohydrolase
VKLLIATHNMGKKREFAQLLTGLDLEMVTLDDLHITTVIPETGENYAANARTKAQGYAAMAEMVTLADDSGLEVDALGGEPGVYSARFGGEVGDFQRCQMLLQRMLAVPFTKRTARFRCVIALAWPDGTTVSAEGVCEGKITTEMNGTGGFGYDPIFWVEEVGKTMAELPSEVKNRISHRARAAFQIRMFLNPS